MKRIKDIIYILLFFIAAGGFWMQAKGYKDSPTRTEMINMAEKVQENTETIWEISSDLHIILERLSNDWDEKEALLSKLENLEDRIEILESE